jgi:hypothetical protein
MDFSRLPAYELEERAAAGGDLCSDTWADMSMRERFDLAHRWLSACLCGWSYTEPLTDEMRRSLDAPTLLWAYTAAVAHNFLAETPEEKKADSPPSTPISTASPAPDAPAPGS